MPSNTLDQTFSALAHPVRRDMLARLSKGHASVNELAAPFDISLPAISKHIKVLERAGLITQGKRAQFRPCALNAAPLEAASAWIEDYRIIWEARFDQMDAILANIAEPQNDN